jgi:type VI secretion system protein VasG
LPDKAVDVLDTACARVRISLAAAPQSLERLRNELAQGCREQSALTRDASAGLKVDQDALHILAQRIAQIRIEAQNLEQRWLVQQQLAQRLLGLRQQRALLDRSVEPINESAAELDAELQRTLSQAQAAERLVSYEQFSRSNHRIIA